MEKQRKFLLIIYVLVGTIFLCNTSIAGVSTKKWYTKAASYEKVYKAAKKKKKPFILFFYTDWCGYCKQLNKKYLRNSKVKKILSRHFKIKINPDKGKKEKALAEKNGIRGYPDFRVVLPNGSSIKLHPFKGEGKSWTVKKFTAELKTALAAGS